MRWDRENWNWKKIAAIGGGVVVCSVLAYLLWPSSTEKAQHPDGYKLVCQNPDCRHEFTMSVADAEAYRTQHPGEPIHCPKCGGVNVIQAGARVRPTATSPESPPASP